MIEKILKMTTTNYLPVDKVRLLQVDWFWGLQYNIVNIVGNLLPVLTNV